jgi:hypothetical protein
VLIAVIVLIVLIVGTDVGFIRFRVPNVRKRTHGSGGADVAGDEVQRERGCVGRVVGAVDQAGFLAGGSGQLGADGVLGETGPGDAEVGSGGDDPPPVAVVGEDAAYAGECVDDPLPVLGRDADGVAPESGREIGGKDKASAASPRGAGAGAGVREQRRPGPERRHQRLLLPDKGGRRADTRG